MPQGRFLLILHSVLQGVFPLLVWKISPYAYSYKELCAAAWKGQRSRRATKLVEGEAIACLVSSSISLVTGYPLSSFNPHVHASVHMRAVLHYQSKMWGHLMWSYARNYVSSFCFLGHVCGTQHTHALDLWEGGPVLYGALSIRRRGLEMGSVQMRCVSRLLHATKMYISSSLYWPASCRLHRGALPKHLVDNEEV